MSLKMSKQAILELLNSNAAKYRKAYSRKAKGEQPARNRKVGLCVQSPASSTGAYPGSTRFSASRGSSAGREKLTYGAQGIISASMQSWGCPAICYH